MIHLLHGIGTPACKQCRQCADSAAMTNGKGTFGITTVTDIAPVLHNLSPRNLTLRLVFKWNQTVPLCNSYVSV